MKWYIGSFVADDGTKFFEGPFYVGGEKYDYKFEERDGSIDYCDQSQMLEWKVVPKRTINKK